MRQLSVACVRALVGAHAASLHGPQPQPQPQPQLQPSLCRSSHGKFSTLTSAAPIPRPDRRLPSSLLPAWCPGNWVPQQQPQVFLVCLYCKSDWPSLATITLLTWIGAIPLTAKLHPFRHCLHTRTWILILNYFLIFRCKHSQHARHLCHVNMACNPWLETWDVAIIHTGGKRICVTVQWITVDHMTLSSAELNLIWTATVNSHAMTGESQTQSWTIASVHPLHYFAINTDRFSQ